MSSGDGRNRRGDDELLATLYADGDDRDTLDGANGEAGAEGDDLDRELAQLRQLRGMFAELKASQEEPPPEGMAFLMAAARQAAVERRSAAPAGWWARLRAGWQAMVAHPAMTAAAAAVVVIGASGYLMSRGVVKHAELTYSSGDTGRLEEPSRRQEPLERSPDGERPAAAAAPMATPALEPAQEEDSAGAPMAGGTGAGVANGQGARAPTDAPAEGSDQRPDRRDAQDLRLRRPAKAEKPKAPRAQQVADGRAPSPEDAKGEAAAGQGAGGRAGGKDVERGRLDDNFAKQNSDGEAAPGSAGAPAAEAPPPPAASAAPAKAPPKKPASTDEDGAGEAALAAEAAGSEEAREPSKPSRVESITQKSERWYKLARSAAAKGNCSEVRLLAERVRGEDPSFYERRFLKDAALQKCL